MRERRQLVARIKEIEASLTHKVFGAGVRAALEHERRAKLDRLMALDARVTKTGRADLPVRLPVGRRGNAALPQPA